MMHRALVVSASILFTGLFLAAPAPAGVPGPDCAMRNCDSNGDGVRDISDGIFIFAFLFTGGPPIVPFCPGVELGVTNGDCNGDEGIDVSDGIRLLSHLFGDLPEPVENTADSDGDGVVNAADNCPSAANADQLDADADGAGDVCDSCPATSNPGQEDGDGDGKADA